MAFPGIFSPLRKMFPTFRGGVEPVNLLKCGPDCVYAEHSRTIPFSLLTNLTQVHFLFMSYILSKLMVMM